MITSPLLYLFTLAFLATVLHLLEPKFKFFKYVPAVVTIYAFSMLLAGFGLFDSSSEIKDIYKLTKTNLLPAMLFLMLLQIDFKEFFHLGRSLLISYLLAIFSIGISFIVVAKIFDFSSDMSGAFGALAGSWMGGTANMIAVGSALDVPQEAFGYALIVDSVNYTFWVMFLLFLVPFASVFNRFTKSEETTKGMGDIGCACTIGAKRYWLLIALSLAVSLLSQVLAQIIPFISTTTSMVIFATIFGIGLSFTPLKRLNGADEVATSMLYMLIALIGSQAIFESFDGVFTYVFAGFSILFIHAILMVIGAKIFRLDLFSIGVASLANIGGVASAPILAATYNKSLVGIGVVMAIMGYLIGTFGGLLVGNILVNISS
jgi:uncharacterized membrane protein